MATSPGRVVTYNEELPSIMSQDPGLPRSRDKLNTIYLHYHNDYCHKT